MINQHNRHMGHNQHMGLNQEVTLKERSLGQAHFPSREPLEIRITAATNRDRHYQNVTSETQLDRISLGPHQYQDTHQIVSQDLDLNTMMQDLHF